MKVLAIGNSFSQDALRYLHSIAENYGINIKTVNLYIGGCSLRKHYLNILDDEKAYEFEFNGEKTGLKVSIREALASDDWDYITLQQASHFSCDYSTYVPYITTVADFARKYSPKAKILIHQTWAYEAGSKRLCEELGFEEPQQMFDSLKSAYDKAAELICADGIIPAGAAMMNAITYGIEKIHRDTFHADLTVGRYILSLTWLSVLTGKSIDDDNFNGFADALSEADRVIAKRAVTDAVMEYKRNI